MRVNRNLTVIFRCGHIESESQADNEIHDGLLQQTNPHDTPRCAARQSCRDGIVSTTRLIESPRAPTWARHASRRFETTEAADILREWLDAHRRIFVLTGAGISTPSGIPDYRGPDGLWKRNAPITYQAFMRDPAMRARYWARSFVGWPVVARAQPNRAHDALVALEERGRIAALVTQNVDGLHTRAGHRDVIDLHGRIDQVDLHDVLRAQRRGEDADAPGRRRIRHGRELNAATAPDGDADLERVGFFLVPRADLRATAADLLKPDVVFFGENVPRERVGRRAGGARAGRCDARGRLVADGLFGIPFRAHGARTRPADRAC